MPLNLDQVDINSPDSTIVVEVVEEPIICENCGFVNIVYKKEYDRRKKKNRHIPISDPVYERLAKLSKGRFGNIDSAIQYLFHMEDRLNEFLREKNASETVKEDIQVL